LKTARNLPNNSGNRHGGMSDSMLVEELNYLLKEKTGMAG